MFYLALLPAVVLLIYICAKDRVEKEPPALIMKLFLFGALTTVSAMILEMAAESLFEEFLMRGDVLSIAVENVLFIALFEEIGKYFVLKKVTWRSPDFNYIFDAVVYGVTVSLGFAALENIFYVADGGVGVAVMRAVFSVPGHAMFGVFMGCHYGAAKNCEAAGDPGGMRRNLTMALWIPTLIHGFYDFCLSMENEIFLLVFLAFEAICTIVAIRTVNRMSKEDHLIGYASAPTDMMRQISRVSEKPPVRSAPRRRSSVSSLTEDHEGGGEYSENTFEVKSKWFR